jgi:hypothetical protein
LDTVTIELLDKHLPHDADQQRAAAIAMLRDWANEDQNLSDEAAAEMKRFRLLSLAAPRAS